MGSVRFTLRLPRAVHEAVVLRAQAAGRSVNAQVVHELRLAERGQVGGETKIVVVDMTPSGESAQVDVAEVERVIERVLGSGW